MIGARVIALGIGYLFGLFQTGYLYGKSQGIDIRSEGSGNAGTTNSLRVLGIKAGLITFAGDLCKAILAVLLVKVLFRNAYPDAVKILELYAGFGAVLGHNFPFYLKFKGGKGILAACGAILLMNPDLFVVLFIGFVPIAFITRIVSLASVLGASAYPILVYIKCRLIGRPPLLDVTFALICGALILYLHRENIKRLLKGTEKKIGRPGK